MFLVYYSINAWLHFTNNNFYRRISRLTHQTSLLIYQPFFYCDLPKSTSDKFTLLESFEESPTTSDLYDLLKETRSS